MHKLLHFLQGILIAVHIVSAPVQVPQIDPQTVTTLPAMSVSSNKTVSPQISASSNSNNEEIANLKNKVQDLQKNSIDHSVPNTQINKPTVIQNTITNNTASAPVTIQQPVPIQYSDYILKYTVTQNSDCGNNNYYNFYSDSDRNIIIKKMVVQVPENSYVDNVQYEFSQNSNSSDDAGFMSELSNGMWSEGNLISVKKSNFPLTITFNDTGKNCGTSNVTPLFDQWIVWDKTSNKQVKLENDSTSYVPPITSTVSVTPWPNFNSDPHGTSNGQIARYSITATQEDMSIINIQLSSSIDINNVQIYCNGGTISPAIDLIAGQMTPISDLEGANECVSQASPTSLRINADIPNVGGSITGSISFQGKTDLISKGSFSLPTENF